MSSQRECPFVVFLFFLINAETDEEGLEDHVCAIERHRGQKKAKTKRGRRAIKKKSVFIFDADESSCLYEMKKYEYYCNNK